MGTSKIWYEEGKSSAPVRDAPFTVELHNKTRRSAFVAPNTARGPRRFLPRVFFEIRGESPADELLLFIRQLLSGRFEEDARLSDVETLRLLSPKLKSYPERIAR